MTEPLCYIPAGKYTIKGNAMAATDEWNKMTQTPDPSLGDWTPTVGAYPQRMPDGKEWPLLEVNFFGRAEIYGLSVKAKTGNSATVNINGHCDEVLREFVFRMDAFEEPAKVVLGFDDPDGYGRNFILTHVVAMLEKNNFNKIELLNDQGKVRVDRGVSSQRAQRPAPN